MSTNAVSIALRAVAQSILKQADAIDGQGVTVSTDKPVMIAWFDGTMISTDEANARMHAMAEERTKPHAWIDFAPGHITDAGDNDKPDDALFRDFGPFMDAATRNDWKDSTGERFTVQNVKKRANELVGFGQPAWDYVRGEVRRLQLSPEGYAWSNAAANMAAGIVPKGLA